MRKLLLKWIKRLQRRIYNKKDDLKELDEIRKKIEKELLWTSRLDGTGMFFLLLT